MKILSQSERRLAFTQELLKNRTIILEGYIDQDSVDTVLKSLEFLQAQGPREPIQVIFNSFGGDVEAGLQIYYLLLRCGMPVYGYVKTRMCKSIAAVILQACTIRYMYRYSAVLVHAIIVNRNVYELQKEDALVNSMKQQAEIEGIFAERTRQPLDRIVDIMKKGDSGQEFGANAALDFGLIDKIV